MKLKNFFQILGFRGKSKHHPYRVYEYDVGENRTALYAQWEHPGESRKVITPELVKAYSEFVSEGDFCIDIGAHSGATSLAAGIAAGPSGCVLSFEPNPFVYHVLEKNARANRHIANIRTMMAAAAPEEGFIDFEYSDSGYCNGGRHENMSVFRHGHAFELEVFAVDVEKELDEDFKDFLPRLSYIKVDAEGYDLYILKSLKNVIEKYRPVIRAEVFKKTSADYRRDLVNYFHGLGYKVYKVIEDPFARGDELTVDNLSLGTHYDVLCLPDAQ